MKHEKSKCNQNETTKCDRKSFKLDCFSKAKSMELRLLGDVREFLQSLKDIDSDFIIFIWNFCWPTQKYVVRKA